MSLPPFNQHIPPLPTGAGPVETASITLSATQLSLLNSAPITIVPQQAGVVLSAIGGVAQYEAGTVAFDNTNPLIISAAGGSKAQMNNNGSPVDFTVLSNQASVFAQIPGTVENNVALVVTMASDLGLTGSITGLTVDTAEGLGQGYVVGDTGTINQNSNTDATYRVLTIDPGSQGGYAVNDTVQPNQNGSSDNAVLTVLTVDGSGKVLTLGVTSGGTSGYTTANAIPVSTLTGSGTGLTVDITAAAGIITAAVVSTTGGAPLTVALTDPGQSYSPGTNVPTTPTSGNGDTGMVVSITSVSPNTGTLRVDVQYTATPAYP